ncbi:hypothetical protein [Pseudomonas helleri]|uniref:hypothetical protein n=1 Tax=Pseudomonas helleri TaxID=1608996 RepID=UPI0030D9CDE6
MSLPIKQIRKPQAGYPLPFIDDVSINGGLNYLALKADPTLEVIINCGPFYPAVSGDRIDLYWKGSDGNERQVGTRTFKADEIIASFPIPVAVALEAQEGLGEIRYTYTDAANTYPSDPMPCLIKTTVPGNPYSGPNLPETIYINEAMSAPTVDPVDIDLGNVARGAIVTISAWEYMSVGDVVTLNWGGYPLKQKPLELAQVDQTLVIIVSEADILVAGNSDELPVSYEIRDVVNNWSLNSPATLINVDTNVNLLEKPDCVDVDAGILNYDSLGSDSSLVMVRTPAPIFTVGDVVTLYWKGFNAQGAAIETHYELPVASVTGRLRFDVPNEDVALFIGGPTTSVFYTVDSTSTGKLETSRSVMFAVIGTQADLPAPTLENGLVAGVFEPATLPGAGARVSLPAYPGMGEHDRIFLSWAGEDSNGSPLHGSVGEELESADVGVTFEFLVDKSEFMNLGDGSEVLFSYVVIFAAGGTRDSLVATYSVKNVIVGNLLKPHVLEAPDDDFLDPSEPLFTKAHVQIPDNVLLLANDRIDMLWDSPLNEGDFPDFMNIRTDGIGIVFEVPKARVEKSLGRDIVVSYTLTRSGAKLYDSDVLTLFIGSASDRLLPRPFVVEADNDAGTLDPDAVTGTYAHVLIKAADINVEVNDEVLLSWAGSEAGGSFDDSNPISGSEAGKDVTFDVPKGFVDANLNGTLTVEYTVIRALDGLHQGSKPRELTVGRVSTVAPDITLVQDSADISIPDGGETSDTAVTITGTAQANGQVEIFDGVTTKGTALANDTGIWTLPLTGLALGSHSLTAKALYGAGQVSAAWTFSITAETAPLITSLIGSGGGAIANGGSTSDTSVTAKGTALANGRVEIFDGVTSKGTATVSSAEEWTHTLTGLAVGSHTLTVKALYGAGQVSDAWAFTVVAEIPELTIDETPVILDGKIYIYEKGRLEARYDSSTSITRTAQGGVPPYTYSNRGSGTGLLIDPVTGYVRALDNVGGWVVVTDSVGSIKSYYVQVTGVIDVAYLGQGTWSGVNQGAHDRGGWLPSVSELREIYSVFGGSQFPYAGKIWSSEKAGLIPPSYHTLNMQTGAEGSALQNVMLDAIWLFFEEYK